MRGGKAQSTIDFITANLGVFMLMLLLVILLLYIGIANANIRQERCDIDSPFLCKNFGVGENSGLTLQIGHRSASPLVIYSVSCTKTEDIQRFVELKSPVAIAYGDFKFVSGGESGNRVMCNGAKKNELFVGDVCVHYGRTDIQSNHTTCGSIMAKTG